MKVFVESVLECPPEAVWREVQTSRLLHEVMHPLARVEPLDEPLPERWAAAATVRCRLYIFGFVPLGIRTLVFERVDQEAREIQTRECDPLIRRWDHLIRVKPTGDGRTQYSDEIEIDAGGLTLPVWLFAQWFYRHRQRRWRRVARRLAQQPIGILSTG